MSSRQLTEGSRIGRYEIKGRLGAGGFAITYHGWDEILKRRVVIKEYFPHEYAKRSADSANVTNLSKKTRDTFTWGLNSFLEEGRTLAKFSHPHIVRVIEFIESNNTAYLIMDFVEGIPLTQFLKKNDRIDNETLTSIFLNLLDALTIIHGSSYLHRDIKPDNIIITADEKPILIDFGAARLALEHKKFNLTRVMTPGFGPIEQLHNPEDQGPWTDLYALGGTMYYCITGGENPATAEERIVNHSRGNQDLLINICETAADQYDTFFLRAVMWMLEIEHSNRPQSVNDVLTFLNNTGDQEEYIKTVIISDTSANTGDKAAHKRNSKSSFVIPGIFGLLLLLGGAYWVFKKELNPPTTLQGSKNEASESGDPIDVVTTNPDSDNDADITLENSGQSEESGAVSENSNADIDTDLSLDNQNQSEESDAVSENLDVDTDVGTTSDDQNQTEEFEVVSENLDVDTDVDTTLDDQNQTEEPEVASENLDIDTDVDTTLDDQNQTEEPDAVSEGPNADADLSQDKQNQSKEPEGASEKLDTDSDANLSLDGQNQLVESETVSENLDIDTDAEITLDNQNQNQSEDSEADSENLDIDSDADKTAEDHGQTVEPAIEKQKPIIKDLPLYSIFNDELIDEGVQGPELVVIAPGKFRMGDILGSGKNNELPVHDVTIGKKFAMSRYEITFNDYGYFVKSTNADQPDDNGFGRGNNPVINVSWNDAINYTSWLSKQTGYQYRLPSESEWEYVTRAGTLSKYWWGDNPSESMANYSGAGTRDKWEQISPVGMFPVNFYSIYDTLGNVSEWVMDCYSDSYQNATVIATLENTSDCTQHVIRGGSWNDDANYHSVSSRSNYPSDSRSIYLGFRVIREF